MDGVIGCMRRTCHFPMVTPRAGSWPLGVGERLGVLTAAPRARDPELKATGHSKAILSAGRI